MKPLNDIMEIDHVIRVHEDGTVTWEREVYAPELFDGELHQHWESPQWSLMDGYSGQQGYSGPLMHQSEVIGGGMERDILAQPGLYVALTNYPADGSDELTEWAVAYCPDPGPSKENGAS